MSIEDQIIEAQRTTVLVTPCGGISFLGIFLRSRASAVVAGEWDPTRKGSHNPDYFLWEYFTEVNTIYYDVLLSEVTILPSGNSEMKSRNDFRYYGSVTVNTSRIERLVGICTKKFWTLTWTVVVFFAKTTVSCFVINHINVKASFFSHSISEIINNVTIIVMKRRHS